MKYTKFIPTYFFSTRTEEWEEVNPEKNNWMELKHKLHCKNISQFTPDLIMVIFNEEDSQYYPVCGLYRGILE